MARAIMGGTVRKVNERCLDFEFLGLIRWGNARRWIMHDHRNADVAKVWDSILKSDSEPIAGLRGKPGTATPLYTKLFKKKGVYVIQDSSGRVVYVGISGNGDKEGSLADRLWSHSSPSSTINRRFVPRGLKVADCTVRVHVEPNSRTRRRIEKYGIAVFDPPGNED